MATSREMTSGRPFPLILNFAFPLLLGNLLQQTYSLMDAAIVGNFLGMYLQPIITQYFIDNKSEIWLLFLIAHSKM